jgi:hypothetical protein
VISVINLLLHQDEHMLILFFIHQTEIQTKKLKDQNYTITDELFLPKYAVLSLRKIEDIVLVFTTGIR